MIPVSDRQLLLVVGAPRSGTSWLHRMLATHPSVAALDKELTTFIYLALWDDLFHAEKANMDQRRWDQGAPLLYGEQEFQEHLRSMAHHAYGRVLSTRPNATHVLDKHPNYALHIPLINRLFPSSKVVHIIRDGREVVVSMMSAKRRIGFGEAEIHGATRHWANNLMRARRDGSALGPGRYMEVRYEDMRTATQDHLAAVFNFCGLHSNATEVQRIAAEFNIENRQVSRGDTSLNALRSIPDAIWKNKLSLEERWTMDRMAGHLLQELGYAGPRWWAVNAGDSARIAWLLARNRTKNTLGSAWHTWKHTLPKQL
jgi:hypothetical protein